ncbi:MAG: hypothetical protein R3Y29_04025 [bacterium]
MGLSAGDIIIILLVVAGAGFGILVYFNKKASVKLGEHQEMIDRAKQTTSIFVIDKKRCKVDEINLPKMVTEQMPKHYKYLKLNFVQAKVGPQILTLICDKKVYEALTVKKNVKVELAGMYIVSVVGMKTDAELKQLKKERKEKEKLKKIEEREREKQNQV